MRPFLGGIHGVMSLAFKAARYPSLSYPLSPIIQARVVWERGICELCTDMIAYLTFTEAQDHRSVRPICAALNKNRSLIGYTNLDEAIESELNSLGKQINKA